MKLMSWFRKDFSVDLYKYTLNQSGTTVGLTFDRTLKVHADSDGTGRLYIQTDEPLAIEGRVRNVVDRKGKLLTPHATDEFRIVSMQPIVDVWGNLNRYRYTAMRVQQT